MFLAKPKATVLERSPVFVSDVNFKGFTINEYHLQFVNSDVDEDYPDDVNKFLQKLFKARSPLVYQHHEITTKGAKRMALVRFQLSKSGISSHMALETAGRDLCRLIFQPESRRWLSLVTNESILGVSPACNSWQHLFSRAFFTSSIHRGPPMLQEMASTFKRDYLPPWALILCFTIFAGMNFGIFVDGVISEQSVGELLGVAGAGFASQILERFADQQATRPRAELEREWKVEYGRFKSGMSQASIALARYHDPLGATTPSGIDDGRTPQEEVCDALWELAESAANLVCNNKEILLAFKAARTRAENELALKGAAVGLSLWAGYSAFWTVTTVTSQVLPLAMWGLGDVLGAVLLAEVPMLVTTTTTLWWCPPVALAAGAGALVCSVQAWKKNKERQAHNARIKYHEAMKDYVCQAWGLAQDTQKILQWIHCVNMARPKDVDFVDDNARQRWQAFITKVRQAAGAEPTTAELGPRFVRTFLSIQQGTLDRVRLAVVEAEKKASIS